MANNSATSAEGPSSSTIRIVSAGGKFGMHGRFGRLDRHGVHHLHGGGNDPGRDDLRDGRSRFADAVERGQQRLHTLRLSQDPHDGLGHDRQRAFAADEEPEHVGTRRIGERAANLHEIAVRQHRLDGEDVMHGEAVLQTVRAAGVLGDVAADRAHLLTRRIGRVVVPERRDLPRDLQIGDARFHRDSPVGDVDVEHAIQLGEADDHAAGHRQRAAGEPGPMASRHERHAFLVADAHDRLHVGGGPRKQDEIGQAAKVRQGIALVGHQLHRFGEHGLRSDRASLNCSTSR